jgi:E3 ubiquitin-protein ligase listerin
VIPASVRAWFGELRPPPRGWSSSEAKAALREYTARAESPHLARLEVAAAEALKDDTLQVAASGLAREMVASVEVDEGAVLELSIQLPACFPLEPAEVRDRAPAVKGRCCVCYVLRVYKDVQSQRVQRHCAA